MTIQSVFFKLRCIPLFYFVLLISCSYRIDTYTYDVDLPIPPETVDFNDEIFISPNLEYAIKVQIKWNQITDLSIIKSLHDDPSLNIEGLWYLNKAEAELQIKTNPLPSELVNRFNDKKLLDLMYLKLVQSGLSEKPVLLYSKDGYPGYFYKSTSNSAHGQIPVLSFLIILPRTGKILHLGMLDLKKDTPLGMKNIQELIKSLVVGKNGVSEMVKEKTEREQVKKENKLKLLEYETERDEILRKAIIGEPPNARTSAGLLDGLMLPFKIIYNLFSVTKIPLYQKFIEPFWYWLGFISALLLWIAGPGTGLTCLMINKLLKRRG